MPPWLATRRSSLGAVITQAIIHLTAETNSFKSCLICSFQSFGQQKGNAEEKKFAEMMLADHTKTSTELKSMVPANLKAALPTALDDASQKKITKLRDAKPENFASEYDSMQVSAHKDAVSLFERYANGGEDPKLKDWAGKTLPALKHHLEMAQALDKNRK